MKTIVVMMPGQKFQQQKQKLKRTTVSCPAPSSGLKHLIPPILRVLPAKCAHLRLTLGISLRWGEAVLTKVMSPSQDHVQWLVPAVFTQSAYPNSGQVCQPSPPELPKGLAEAFLLTTWQFHFFLFPVLLPSFSTDINPESSTPQNSCRPGYPPSWGSLMT